jgi:MFS transporter, DHA1 family, multidrug resistance protein
MDKNESGVQEAVAQVIEHARDWTSHDDPDNPRNYSLWRRIFSTIAVTLLAFVTTFGASIYSAGIDDVTKTFNVAEEVATLPLSLYNVGKYFKSCDQEMNIDMSQG